MKPIVFVASLLLFLALPAAAADLTIDLQDIHAPGGRLKVAVVSAEGWEGKAPAAAAQMRSPSGREEQVVFHDLPAGRYAVQVMHDENGNGRLDTNIIGMPTEGYGFSNNPRVMRKPTFDEAAFDLPDQGTAIVIKLR
ncbi:DUF2141 domain-containing protein [Pseudoxanthomonas winnipegensis]|uniref:DUF2141 domain-containing protein n=1 Tax=Pseudoxanthomonas winnipegensis TaxID=2480810 RepID=UPI0025763417|nr:DUF2141 domain-containing protein [Pseudoxanthomonas winnipegensis]WJI15776.1 DUF2141 domain-containing protein [Pseudoxanthomonas winnipegensis]